MRIQLPGYETVTVFCVYRWPQVPCSKFNSVNHSMFLNRSLVILVVSLKSYQESYAYFQGYS